MPVTAPDNIQPSDTSEWGRVKNATKSVTDYDAHAAQAHSVAVAPLGTPDNPNSAIFTLANFVTLCRFGLTVAFLYLFVNHADRSLALTLYAVAAVTDFLDGWIARTTQSVSWLGKIMDPIMDRFLLFTGVLGLVARGDVPTWIAWFVLGRDAVLLVGSIALQHFRRRPVDVLGLVSASWLPVLNQQGGALGLLFVYAGIICSTYTAILYYLQGIHIAIQSKRAAQ